MKIKALLLTAAAAMLVACGGGKSDKKPQGTALGSGGPAASGPTGSNAHGGGGEDPHGGGEGKKKAPPEVTVYLMGRFIAALSEKPTNAEPAPDWQVLLADPNDKVTCESCHPASIVKSMLATFDPNKRPEGIETWEKDIPYMKELMGKWVKRANSKDPKHTASGKLKGELKCTSCHAKVPN